MLEYLYQLASVALGYVGGIFFLAGFLGERLKNILEGVPKVTKHFKKAACVTMFIAGGIVFVTGVIVAIWSRAPDTMGSNYPGHIPSPQEMAWFERINTLLHNSPMFENIVMIAGVAATIILLLGCLIWICEKLEHIVSKANRVAVRCVMIFIGLNLGVLGMIIWPK